MVFPRTSLGFLLLFASLLLSSFCAPEHLRAAGFEMGSEVNIDSDREGDLYLAGGKVNVEAKVGEDLLIAGGRIDVEGDVGADLMVSGGEMVLKGSVEDDIRVFGGDIRIEGDAGGDLLVFGGNVKLEKGSSIEGMLKVYGGSVILKGKVKDNADVAGGDFEHRGMVAGELKLRTGHATIGGVVNGQSVLASRTLHFEKGAELRDDVHYWRRKGEIDLSPYIEDGEAILDPALKHKVMGDVGWTVLFFGFWMAWAIHLVSAALILFLLNFFLTRSFQRAGIAMEHLGKSMGYGALYLFGTPLATLLLLFTLIGAPIAIVTGTLWGLSLLFTHLLSAAVVTHWLKVRYNKAWDRAYLFLVSLGVYAVIKLISQIPIFGSIFSLLIVISCFGALILARRALFTNRPMLRI